MIALAQERSIQFDNRTSKMTGDSLAGLEYDSELAGPRGCAVTIFAFPGTTHEQIEAAKDDARSKFDVVTFYVQRINREQYDEEMHQPQPREGGWIDAARWIVENKTARRIDETGALVPENKRGGILLDLTTAGLMVKIIDALNDERKAKFNNMEISIAANVAWKLVS